MACTGARTSLYEKTTAGYARPKTMRPDWLPGVLTGTRDILADYPVVLAVIADAPYTIGDFIVLGSGERGFVVNVGVAYGSDLDRVCTLLDQVAQAHPEVARSPKARVRTMAPMKTLGSVPAIQVNYWYWIPPTRYCDPLRAGFPARKTRR